MLNEPTKSQLIDIARACERDAETTLHASIINKYAAKNKLKTYLINEHFVGFIIEEVIVPEAELIQLFIFPEYRGSGFGTLLCGAWIASLKERKLEKAFLEVRDGNEAAIKIYQALGFKIVGKRKNYYQLNLGVFDALLMEVEL